MSAETLKRIDKARWWLLTKQPFYGSLAMSLADVIDPTIATACTDGRVIRWNPEFVAELSDAELRFSLLHETLHCAHGHMWRLPMDADGNAAGDYAINDTISGLADVSMPEGCLLDKKYSGLSEEEIYGHITNSPKQKPKKPESGEGNQDGPPQPGDQPQPGAGGGDQDPPKSGDQPQPQPGSDDGQSQPSGGGGDKKKPGSGSSGGGGKASHGETHGHTDSCSHFAPPKNPDLDQAQQDIDNAKLREDWEQRVIQAAQASQAMGAGDIPADMERLLDKMRAQEVDWRRELADFVKNMVSTRNDWSRAARRHAWQPVIYPRRQQDSVGTVLFARDTSGSIDMKACSQFTALINACVEEMGCEGIVVDCNTAIQAEYRVNDYEKCPDVARGSGGTRFQPVFDRAAELEASGEQIAGIVYLTDLDAPAPDEPDIPTLWLTTADREPPFGRAVRVEVER